MAYVNLYNSSVGGYLRRLARIGSYTYVLGWGGSNQPYLAKLQNDGTLVWQKRYEFSGADNGGWVWFKSHYTDIVEISATGDLILLVSDQSNFLVVKLDSDGEVIWVKKHYDQTDTPLAYNGLSSTARLFKLNDETLVLKIAENHSRNGGVLRIDHRFYSIDPKDGVITASRRIISQNPILIFRDEEVRRGELVMFGYKNGEAAILTLDASLNIAQSSALYYNGELQGFNYLHIYAVSPVYNGRYSVLGSFYHYNPSTRSEEDLLDLIANDWRNERLFRAVREFAIDYTEPLPSRFNRFFMAEISEDHGSVNNERLLERDFTATYQTIHQNSQGIFFSVSNQLYKCNSGLTGIDWVKMIRVPELSRANNLLINKSIGNSFDAYSTRTAGEEFSIASTGLDYDSCKTAPVEENVALIRQNFAIKRIDISIEEFSPREYEDPSVEVISLKNEMEELCSAIPIPDLEKSTITANPTSIAADGTATSQITVTLKDAQGNTVNPSNHTVQITTNAGTWTGGVTTTGNGIYKRQLRSSTTQQTATVTFSVTGIGTGPHSAAVQFIRKGKSITIKDGLTSLQSPYLYIQAAGSDGADSTKGRHLRWAFRGVLGEKHLPKGDYAVNYVNFNKPKDNVKIYKAAYVKKRIRLELIKERPAVVDDTNHLWIYRIEGKEFYLRFENTTKYNQIRASINPLENPAQFIASYGSEPLEVENIKDPFFGVSCNFTSVGSGAQFKVETLSISTPNINAYKVVSNRKTISSTGLATPLNLLMENGRSVRWEINNAQLASIDFEFYSDTIQAVNKTTGWLEMGDFALTKEDAVALKQLEPSSGDVNGVWHRFDAQGLVNTDNYKEKWNATPEPGDRNIKQVVSNYIQLSENASNFSAIEDISLGNNPSDPEDYMEISNLDMLNFSSNDYHIARMLGLGVLDTEIDGSVNDWLYVAEYYTTADLEDGQGKREVQHLFMSLPTSNTDFRLPVPIDLDHIAPGVFLDDENGNNSSLTDDDGYTYDGISRYVSLYSKELPEDAINTPFFVTSEEVNLSIVTTPVYGGLKYRINSGGWVKPELSNDPRYYNEVPSGEEFYETRFILIPEPLRSYYVHKQSASGTHRYRSYGINWFSRAKVSAVMLAIDTVIKQKNPLVPPSNTAALLVREESPLFLTSQEEQQRLDAINNSDNTLIRLTYDYHSFHELKNYTIPVDSPYSNLDLVNQVNNPAVLFPDNEEVFAEEVAIVFRNEMPNNVTGKALSVSDHSTNEVLSVISTGIYDLVTTGETITPTIPSGDEGNYVGGVFVSGNNQYIIHEVTQGSQGPVFVVYKKEISDSIVNGGGIPSTPLNGALEAPLLVTDGLFMAIENMQTPSSWGSPNPLGLKVQIGMNWPIHREVIETLNDDGGTQRMVEKTRGIWTDATISIDTQANQEGIYKISFNSFSLAQHPQYASHGVSTEWYKGIVRVFTEDSLSSSVPNKTRKVLSVVKIENIDSSNDLVLYVQDPTYNPNDPNYDAVQIGNNILVNFYPGYKIYLYEDATFGLTEENLLPDEGEDVRYSIFGFRSGDIDEGYLSKIGVPTPMFAQELIEALPPEEPEGALYATRPDFFGRSTYTLTTEYQHKPHGVLFYRTNDEALLNALYEKSTIRSIRENLAVLGGNDEEYLSNRWQNFLDFDQLSVDGDFKMYPPVEDSTDSYRFPNPDKQAFFDWANQILAGLEQPPITEPVGSLKVGNPKIIGFVKGAIYNAFVSLTEMPILYRYLRGENYKPVDKPQVIKDRNGHTLAPGSPGFKMAPMMKVTGTSPHTTLFTDFKLDGTSNNLYFYGVKELSTQMKMSDFSPFLGPIKLVNTNAPEAPEIKRIIPVLENPVLGIPPSIQLEINAFPKVQEIRKINIYRAHTMLEAQSVLSMQLVKTVDLEAEDILDNPVWMVSDDFSDLIEIPYGDGLFYRITVSREVEYAEPGGTVVTEYAPSQASKIVASMMVEVNSPMAPVLSYTSTAPDANDEIHSVVLKWVKTAYKANYHVYKMNSQGNWAKIHHLQTNDDAVVLPLADTDLQSGTLKLTNDEGNAIYHHFKVIAENTAGMLSAEEKILTIPTS